MEPVGALTVNKRPKEDVSDDEAAEAAELTPSKRLSLVSSWFIRENFDQDIPKEVVRIIVEFSKISFESVILTEEEQAYLVEIIEAQRETQRRRRPYQLKRAEWKLLCRGSKDGKTQRAFHDACDGQRHTVCLLDVDSTGYVCGGYASTAWEPGP